MRLTLFFCERAETRSDGKLDTQGIFNELYAPGFPARQDYLLLAGLVEWERDEAGRQEFRIEITDPGGQSIFSINGHTDVDAREASRPPPRSHLIFPLNNLVFPEPGTYRTRVQLAGDTLEGPALYLMSSG